MSAISQQTDDTGKLLRPAAAATADGRADAEDREDADDPTTLKFDGPVRLSDEDAGSDPYNRTGKFKRLIRS